MSETCIWLWTPQREARNKRFLGTNARLTVKKQHELSAEHSKGSIRLGIGTARISQTNVGSGAATAGWNIFKTTLNSHSVCNQISDYFSYSGKNLNTSVVSNTDSSEGLDFCRPSDRVLWWNVFAAGLKWRSQLAWGSGCSNWHFFSFLFFLSTFTSHFFGYWSQNV